MLIQRFKKFTIEHSPKQERLTFWLDIIFEATKETTNGLRFPVRCYVQTSFVFLMFLDKISPELDDSKHNTYMFNCPLFHCMNQTPVFCKPILFKKTFDPLP